MKKHASVEAPSQSSATSGLNPVLQAALSSLEVQLEEELARYRRHQHGRPAQPERRLRFKAPAKHRSLDLISIQPNPSSHPSQPAAATPSASRAAPSSSASPAGAIASPPTASSSTEPATSQPEVPEAALSRSQSPASDSTDSSSLARWESPPNASEALTEAHPEHNPDDYLESSEQLLQSFTDEEEPGEPRDRSGLASHLLTPLGIGSILLLLVASVTLGYVIANPDALSHLRLNRSGQGGEAAPGNEGADANQSALPGDLSTQPDLAAQEFVDLNLGTLSTLPGSPPAPSLANSKPATPGASPAPTPSANGAAANSGTAEASKPAPTSTVPLTSLRAVPAPAPANISPQPSEPSQPKASAPRREVPQPAPLPEAEPAPAPQAPAQTAAAPQPPAPPPPAPSAATAAAPTPPSGSRYYVVTPYTGDQSLSEARQAVEDAYVRNFEDGARIQLGSYGDESTAQERARSLQEQGIEAEVQGAGE